MELINLTPHAVIIIRDGEVILSIPPSDQVAKLPERDIPTGEINGIAAVRKVYEAPVLIARNDFLSKVNDPQTYPLPEEQEGIIYIVPMLVGQQLAGSRDDLYGPDFGIGGVRTADGKIAGAVGFIKY